MIFTVVVILCNLKMLVFTKTHYNFTLFFIFASIAFYVMSFYVFNLMSSLETFNIFKHLHESSYYFLAIWEIIGYTYVVDVMFTRYAGYCSYYC